MNPETQRVLLQTRKQLPWLGPMIAALNWNEGEKESYDAATGTVVYQPDLSVQRAARIATTVAMRLYRKDKSPDRWRQSREHAVNAVFQEGMRDGEYFDKWHEYHADAVYAALGGDDEKDPPPPEPESDENEGGDTAPVRAARGQLAGNESTPPQIREACSTVRVRPITWQDRLKAAVGSLPIQGAMSRSYSRLHRLQACVGNVMLGKAVGYQAKVAVVVDTSGSMWDELDNIRSQVINIVRAVGYDCDVIQCDTEVRGRGRGVAGVANWHGGGGTTIGPGLAEAIKSGAKAVVIITDGYIEDGIPRPKIPVVWCMTTEEKPYPWGTYVRAV